MLEFELWNFIFSFFKVAWVTVKFGERNPFTVAWFFYGKKNGRSRGLSHCECFGHYGKRGTKDRFQAKKCLIKH